MVGFGFSLFAQSGKLSEDKRKEFEAQKVAFFTQEMDLTPDTGLTEIVEIPTHKWFVGTQFHPEYKSTVTNPHPLFVAFVKACLS